MKKLIAISITLALVASAAFAQVTVSGLVSSKWVAFSDSAHDGEDTLNSLSWWGRMKLDAATEDGKFGGSLRILEGTDWDVNNWAYVWWQPIDMLKFQLGKMADGWYPAEDLTAWGFHGDANNFVAYGNNLYTGAAFAAGSLFKSGASFVITPLDGLQVVFGLPYGDNEFGHNTEYAFNGTNAMNTWKHFFLQAGYTIDNLGIITLTYKSGTQDLRGLQPQDKNNPLKDDYVQDSTGKWVPSDKEVDVSKIYASFQLKMIENLGLHFGINYTLPAQFKDTSTGKDAKVNSPLALGLGADYKAGDFGVSARLEFLFLGSYDDGTSSDNVTPTPFKFDIEVLPYYDLGIFKAYLSLAMALTTDTENAAGQNTREAYVDFLVNPYISKAVGAGTFFAGFQLIGKAQQETGKKSSKENFSWGIPVGLQLTF